MSLCIYALVLDIMRHIKRHANLLMIYSIKFIRNIKYIVRKKINFTIQISLLKKLKALMERVKQTKIRYNIINFKHNITKFNNQLIFNSLN